MTSHAKQEDVVISSDENMPAIVKEKESSSSNMGESPDSTSTEVSDSDDNSDGSWDVINQDQNPPQMKDEDRANGAEEEYHGDDDYVDIADSEDNDMATLQKVASIRKVQTAKPMNQLEEPKDSIQVEMAEMKQESTSAEGAPVPEEPIAVTEPEVTEEEPEVVEEPLAIEEPKAVEEPQAYEKPEENQLVTNTIDPMIENTIDSLQKNACSGCRNTAIKPGPGKDTIWEESASGTQYEEIPDDQSVEVQLLNPEDSSIITDEPKPASKDPSGVPSILKRTMSESHSYKIRHPKVGLSKTRTAQPRIPRAPKKQTKPTQVERSFTFGAVSLMKPNPVKMVRRTRSAGQARNDEKEAKHSPVNQGFVPKLPKGVSSDEDKKNRSAANKAALPRSVTTPSNDPQKPIQLRKARTTNSVSFQTPLQSSPEEVKEKNSLPSQTDSVPKSEKLEPVASLDRVDSSNGFVKDECTDSESVSKGQPVAEGRQDQEETNVDPPENSSVTTNNTGVSDNTTKAGNVSVRKLQVFGNTVRKLSEEEGTRLTTPSKIKKSKSKKKLKMLKGLGKSSETVKTTELKPTKQPNTVLKPTKIKSSKDRKKGFSLKMW